MARAAQTVRDIVKKSKSGKGTLTFTPDKEDRAEIARGKTPTAAEEAREARAAKKK